VNITHLQPSNYREHAKLAVTTTAQILLGNKLVKSRYLPVTSSESEQKVAKRAELQAESDPSESQVNMNTFSSANLKLLPRL
jgi:hypothetical protein